MTEPRDPIERTLELLVFVPIGAGLYVKDVAPTFVNMFVARGRAEVDRRQEQVQQHVTTARSLGQVAIAFGGPKVRERVNRHVDDLRGRAEQFLGTTSPVRTVVDEPKPASTPPVERKPTYTPPPAAAPAYTRPIEPKPAPTSPVAQEPPPVPEPPAPPAPPAPPEPPMPPPDPSPLPQAPAPSTQAPTSPAPTTPVLKPPALPSSASGAEQLARPFAASPGPAGAPARPAAMPQNGAATPTNDELPIPGYDALSASQVVERLIGLSAGELEAVRFYETAHRNRRTILGKIEQLTP